MPDGAVLARLPEDAAQVALALASHSRHPLSRALVEALTVRGVKAAELTNVVEVPGEGMRASGKASAWPCAARMAHKHRAAWSARWISKPAPPG
jgi:cation transport ATPase